ncbi:interleukin-12 subunit beta [Parambassis ranga]|uniref:Interleukin-12 subunit beta n=1 Tax=Parambassis ranga TaxID=210632 RepID=A0A6P7J220_9TELE|nr:interleukin-12 subunit beta-like [Parambassis ranga]
METLSRWMFGFLLISLTGAHGLNNFPEKFVVAKRNVAKPVTLTCGAKSDETVTWKFNGEVIEESEDNVQKKGQNLIVSEVDTPMLGAYSCWRGGEMLSSTYLFLEDEEGDDLDTLLRCRAKSYDCSFSCVWTNSKYTAVRLRLGHECREDHESCNWISSNSKRDSNGGFQFEVSHSLSPYAEESTMLELHAQAIDNDSMLRRTKRFYLRDIVQPDSPQIVRCQEVEQDLNVTIDPPPSWSVPHSFFSLEHEIEYILKDDGRTERSSSALIPKRISKLRVRSRDSLVLSPWSQWTPWKNVTH